MISNPSKPLSSTGRRHWSRHEDLLGGMQKRWKSQRLLKDWLAGELVFPLRLPIRRPTGKVLMDDFIEIRHWIEHWQQSVARAPCRLECETVKNRRIGSQSVPRYLVLETAPHLFQWIEQEQAFQQFRQLAGVLLKRWPQTLELLLKSPFRLLALAEQQEALIAVLDWFKQNPCSRRYVRQLDIVGVDSKFIERNKGIIHDLLIAVLDKNQYRADIVALGRHGFERKFGLLYDLPLIRFRILDPTLALSSALAGQTDISVPLDQFQQLKLPLQRVFITENKVNGLAFPPVAGALVVFGMGYGVETLAQVDWLRNMRVDYWGDIDTHGFNILTQVRKHLPQTRSMLMDEATLFACKALWGQEADVQEKIDLSLLTAAETRLIEGLWQHRWQPKLRLEQERIPFSKLTDWLDERPGNGP